MARSGGLCSAAHSDPLHAPTAFQPVPEELAGQLSRGYAFELGKHVEKPFEHVPLGAAGGMESQCSAMTRLPGRTWAMAVSTVSESRLESLWL